MAPSPSHRWATRAIARAAAALLLTCLPASFIASDALAADGHWQPIFIGRRSEHAAIFDPVGNRMIVFGGPSNDAWQLALDSPSSSWAPIDICGTGPTVFNSAAQPSFASNAAYDSARKRMLFYGQGQVWALPLSPPGPQQWTLLATTGTPPDLFGGGQTAVYDATHDELLVYGESNIPGVDPVWVLSLSSNAWSNVVPAGPAPPPYRSGHTAIYDPVRERMVIFGGWISLISRNDVWAFSRATNTWTQLFPGTGPAGRQDHIAVYDSKHDAMIVYGGNNGSGGLSDSWSLSLGSTPAWTALAPGTPGPGPRRWSAGIFDPGSGRLIVFGGYHVADLFQDFDDTWALDPSPGGSWQQLTSSQMPDQGSDPYAAAYDPLRHRAIVLAPHSTSLYSLDLTGTPTWTPFSPGSTLQFYDSSLIYDPVRDRMLLFGGHGIGGPYDYINDTWALSLGNPPQWTLVHTSISRPVARARHRAVYDPVLDRMIIHAGASSDSHGPICYTDTWALSLSSGVWTQIGADPHQASDYSMVYDPGSHRAITFGGNCLGPIHSALRALDLATGNWSALTASGAPPGDRYLQGAAIDPVRDRMVLVGGSNYSGRASGLADVWALSLSGSPAWSQLTPSGPSPSFLGAKDLIYDPPNDRLVAIGQGNVWTLSLADDGDPCEVSTAIELALFEAAPGDAGIEVRWGFGALAVTSSVVERARQASGPWLALAGEVRATDGGFALTDRDVDPGADYWYRIRATMPGGEQEVLGSVHATAHHVTTDLALIAPNPGALPLRLEFALARAGKVKIALYDVLGREVAVIEQGERSAGRHSVSWRGAGASTLGAGVYLVRLSGPDGDVTRRFALVR